MFVTPILALDISEAGSPLESPRPLLLTSIQSNLRPRGQKQSSLHLPSRISLSKVGSRLSDWFRMSWVRPDIVLVAILLVRLGPLGRAVPCDSGGEDVLEDVDNLGLAERRTE